MLIKLKNLYSNLKFRNYFEAGEVLSLFKLAGYEDEFYSTIQELSKHNPKPFNDWFDGQDRVYIPMDKDKNTDADEAIKITLEEKGYTITDYIGGYATKDGRQFRIGKILNNLKNEEIIKEEKNPYYINFPKELEDRKKDLESGWQEFINLFINSPLRTSSKKKNLMVVFSQNPHDIAKMSYGRDWTSCLELGKGSNESSVYCEVKTGGFVAYLIEEDDKNIEKPLARIHIRRFLNANGTNLARPESTTYGNPTSGFDKVVKKWVEEHNQLNISKSTISLAPVSTRQGGYYSDTYADIEVELPKTVEGMLKLFYAKDDKFKINRYKLIDLYSDQIEKLYFKMNLADEYFNLWEEDGVIASEGNYNYKIFNSLNELIKFKSYVEHIDEEYGIWDKFLQDRFGTTNEEKTLGSIDRWEIKNVLIDHSKMIREKLVSEIAKKIKNSQEEPHNIPVAKDLVTYLFNNNLLDGLTIRNLFKKFPEAISEELFVAAPSYLKTQIIDYFENSDSAKNKYQELLKFQDNYLSNILNTNSEIFQTSIIDKTKNRYADMPQEIAINFSKDNIIRDMGEVIAMTLDIPIKEERYQQLLKFIQYARTIDKKENSESLMKNIVETIIEHVSAENLQYDWLINLYLLAIKQIEEKGFYNIFQTMNSDLYYLILQWLNSVNHILSYYRMDPRILEVVKLIKKESDIFLEEAGDTDLRITSFYGKVKELHTLAQKILNNYKKYEKTR